MPYAWSRTWYVQTRGDSCVPGIELTAWPGIKLLGFKSRKDLAFEDNVKHSTFIYPDEMVRSTPVASSSNPGSSRTLNESLKFSCRHDRHTLGASAHSPHCSER